MPFINIENPVDVWGRVEVTFEERRELLKACSSEQRFVGPDHEVYIAHPLNPWCMISNEAIEPVEWDKP